MKKIVTSLILFNLIIIQTSCSYIFKDVHQTASKIETMTNELFYDSIYYSMEFYLSNHKWPTSKDDLIKQGMIKNYKINFDQYKYFLIEQCSEKRINIHFIINQKNNTNQSARDIKGIIGLYIEDENKVNIIGDKQIICSFTIGQNPYTDQKTLVIDGYNVHIFIENNDSSSINNGNITIVNYPMIKNKVVNSK